MKTVAALAYFVLLLGWAAAEEENFSVSQCKDSIFYDADDAEDDVIEECLKMPEIAAVAEGFTGTDDDKRDEIIYQCMSKQAGMFNEGVLDRDAIREFVSYYKYTHAADKAAYQETMDDCDSILQQTYQLAAYIRCVKEYCEKK